LKRFSSNSRIALKTDSGPRAIVFNVSSALRFFCGRPLTIACAPRPRHAAALALVGWYLMQPPLDSGDRPDAKAPLSQWQESGAFDNAAECNKERFDTIKMYEKMLADAQQSKASHDSVDMLQRASLAFWKAQCIASDDPRLKRK